MSPDSRYSDDVEIDVRTLFVSIWKRRFWVVGIVSLFAFGAFSASFLITPTYRATTVLVPAEVGSTGGGALGSALSQFGGLAALAGVDIGSSGSSTEESLAVLRSREFTEAFIRDEGLMPELFPRAARGESRNPPTPAKANRLFDREIRTVLRDTRSGLVTVQIEWRDPVMAAEWANILVNRLNAEMRARAIAKTNASVGYLERELMNTAIVDTRAAISRLMEAQINQRMLANVTEEYALRVVDRALPPDADDFVRPRRLLLTTLSGVVGLVLAIFGCLLVRRSEGPRAHRL